MAALNTFRLAHWDQVKRNLEIDIQDSIMNIVLLVHTKNEPIPPADIEERLEEAYESLSKLKLRWRLAFNRIHEAIVNMIGFMEPPPRRRRR